ncbi:MAG TPA: cytochrome c oxidase subunit II [Bryobacteraceae bacterium]|nr:cytochrome c oxidase subunit II [Bryobacteraceae bacterium]
MGSPFSPHSAGAQSIASVFSLVLFIAAVVFVIVVAGVFYCVVRYRARGAASGEPRQVFGSPRLETLWTIIPLIVMMGLFIVTVRAMILVDAPQDPDHSPDLVVTAHQWWWEARYPNGVLATWDVHIPAGRRLRARIDSADVIHDFWVPDLARKIDAVPGRWSYVWLEADQPGTYAGTCSEFCGAQHAWMRFRVVAQPQSEFDAWLQNEAGYQPNAAPGAGERLFGQKCGECHALSPLAPSSRKGPNLAHIASREFLGGGIARNTPEALMLWLTDPQAAKPGNRMPSVILTPAERAALRGFLETVK